MDAGLPYYLTDNMGSLELVVVFGGLTRSG